ncbi:MAG: serpin family protein [Bacteroidales bacterium]|nr:serpin family protein [Bacteroidales bacterium]
MKTTDLIFLALAVTACSGLPVDEGPEGPVLDPISVSSPVPSEAVPAVVLDATQQGYVRAGNALAFRFLTKLYKENPKDIICSPLSLQYALAMAVNGAEGETATEILGVLGYGAEGVEALNVYSKTMMEQLPAVDLDVALRLADALIVNDRYTLLPSYKETIETHYYAAVESLPFSDPQRVLDRINEWARRNTEGLIDPLLDSLDPSIVSVLMNALYFRARWQGGDENPMFSPDLTSERAFHPDEGEEKLLPFMETTGRFPYAETETFQILGLPYAQGKFYMYILLPKERGLTRLMEELPTLSWTDLAATLETDGEVRLRLPKFDIEGSYGLNGLLQSLGMNSAFIPGLADFGGMFDAPGTDFYISEVLQKAKISVAEWGTEAAAVTVIFKETTSIEPGDYIKFTADHPFVFLIGEQTSGALLFEGVFTGK